MARSRFWFHPDLNARAKRRLFEETFGAEIDSDGDQSEVEHIRACRAEIADPEMPENTRASMIDALAYMREQIAAEKATGATAGTLARWRRDIVACRAQLRSGRFPPMPLL